MERILVGMDASETTLWAVIHAINLAKRIKARVSILVVNHPEAARPGREKHRRELTAVSKQRLESLIEESRSQGLLVDYYVTEGLYEPELIRFIRENGTTLLVVGFPAIRRAGTPAEFEGFLERIRHRINCRIEVVHERPLVDRQKRR